MKKTLFAISAIAVLLGFTACTSENEILEPQVSGKTITIKAYTESSDTRTALDVNEGSDDAGYPVLWTAGDEIMIISDVITSNYAKFTLKSESAKSSTGEFEGSFSFNDNEGYTAYYPADYDGTNWPTAQTYEANNIPLGSPMKATFTYATDEEPSLAFKNEGGILRLNLKGEAKVTSIKISATGLAPITLDCGSTGVELNTTTATPFHIAVPGADDPGTAYSGLKIEITNDAGLVCTKTLKSDKTITVQRSKITDITLTAGSFEHTYVELAGTKWATENVGYVDGVEAEGSDETYGYYYTYDNALQAAESWGSNWELPTKEQWEALKNKCTWSWQNDYSFGGKNMKGYLVTDENNGNSIFLPAAGGTVYGQGDFGNYWSSTPNGSGAYSLGFAPSSQNVGGNMRSNGNSVRAVLAEPTTGTAKATIAGEDVDVNWVQLWAGGPKFAEKNVGATSATDQGTMMTFTEATQTGADYVWGANWRTPSKDDMVHLMTAAMGKTDDKVKCEYQEGSQNGFKFTGKEDGYTDNSVFFPTALGEGSSYWSATVYEDSKAWDMYLEYSYYDWYSDWCKDEHFNEFLVRPVLAK